MSDPTTLKTLQEALSHPHPSQLWYQLDEIVSQGIYLRHGVELDEGSIVLDAGANVGVAASFFAVGCGALRVHSFEPVPATFELLRRNLAQFPACVPHCSGLGREPGRREITYYPGDSALSGMYADPAADEMMVRRVMANRGMAPDEVERELWDGRYEPVTVEIELRTVSSVLREHRLERIDLLKVDVEGAEEEVLGGIDEEDWGIIRQLVIEVHGEARLARVTGSLERRGLRVTTERDEGMRGTGLAMLYATAP